MQDQGEENKPTEGELGGVLSGSDWRAEETEPKTSEEMAEAAKKRKVRGVARSVEDVANEPLTDKSKEHLVSNPDDPDAAAAAKKKK